MHEEHYTLSDYKALIKAKLPGVEYDDVLRQIHALLKPHLYVEIGVQKGKSLSLAREGTYAIGVDPQPSIEYPLAAWTKLACATSDVFFSGYSGPPFDLVFLDGLHLFEATAKDFLNAERFCKPSSVILIHDTIPLTAYTSGRKPLQTHWTGDVWKLIPALIKGRPDLNIFTIACPPSGLTVVSGFSSLKGLSGEIISEFADKEFSWIDADWRGLLNVVANDSSLWISKLSQIYPT